MPGPACGHALFTVDEPAWPVLAAPPGPAAPAAPEGPLLLTVTRAAELLGVSRSTLYQPAWPAGSRSCGWVGRCGCRGGGWSGWWRSGRSPETLR